MPSDRMTRNAHQEPLADCNSASLCRSPTARTACTAFNSMRPSFKRFCSVLERVLVGPIWNKEPLRREEFKMFLGIQGRQGWSKFEGEVGALFAQLEIPVASEANEGDDEPLEIPISELQNKAERAKYQPPIPDEDASSIQSECSSANKKKRPADEQTVNSPSGTSSRKAKKRRHKRTATLITNDPRETTHTGSPARPTRRRANSVLNPTYSTPYVGPQPLMEPELAVPSRPSHKRVKSAGKLSRSTTASSTPAGKHLGAINSPNQSISSVSSISMVPETPMKPQEELSLPMLECRRRKDNKSFHQHSRSEIATPSKKPSRKDDFGLPDAVVSGSTLRYPVAIEQIVAPTLPEPSKSGLEETGPAESAHNDSKRKRKKKKKKNKKKQQSVNHEQHEQGERQEIRGHEESKDREGENKREEKLAKQRKRQASKEGRKEDEWGTRWVSTR
jgi:hypothetical protein